MVELRRTYLENTYVCLSVNLYNANINVLACSVRSVYMYVISIVLPEIKQDSLFYPLPRTAFGINFNFLSLTYKS